MAGFQDVFQDFVEPYEDYFDAVLREEAPRWCQRDWATEFGRCEAIEELDGPAEVQSSLRQAREFFFQSALTASDPMGEAFRRFDKEFPRWFIPRRAESLLFGVDEEGPNLVYDYAWFEDRTREYYHARKGAKGPIRQQLTEAAVRFCQELGLLPAFPRGRPPKAAREDVEELYCQGRRLFDQLHEPADPTVEERVREFLGVSALPEGMRVWEAHFRFPMLFEWEIRAGLDCSRPKSELVVQAIVCRTGWAQKTVENYVRHHLD